MAVQSPLMALLGSTLNPTEPKPTPAPAPTPSPAPDRKLDLEPEPEPEPEPETVVKDGGIDGIDGDDLTPRSSATKIYVETQIYRKISMEPGERCEFAVAVRDGMTVDVSARFYPASGGTPVEVHPVQRSVAVQDSFEADQRGSLEIVLDNGFSWLTNKLVMLSLTQSTAAQRRRVEEEHNAIVEAQERRRKEDEALRAKRVEEELRQARSYIRCEELIQEAMACCPEGSVQQDVVRALREVSVKLMPSVKAAKDSLAKHGGVAAAQ